MIPEKYQKTVTVAGLTWNVMSRNERVITLEGRHFFAGRCMPSRPWTILEFDRSIIEHGTAREVARFPVRSTTKGLGHHIRRIVYQPEGEEE